MRTATRFAWTLAQFAAVLGQDAAPLETVPTVYLPLNYYYGPNHKISTNLAIPGRNGSMEVVFDQGSDNFWVFGPNSTMNWGCTALLCRGPCNTTVTPFYDYAASPDATAPEPFEFSNGYGTFTKVVFGNVSINDTLRFTSAASNPSSTVPGVRVAIVDYMTQRLADAGTCSASFDYDKAIMGIAPYQHGPLYNTTGPSVRQDLLERGVIGAPVMSMWFDQAPADNRGTYTGGAVFGGVDMSKFTGPLVKVPLLTTTTTTASVGYYVALPKVSIGGLVMDQSTVYTDSCLLDSGTQADTLPISPNATEAFFNATGIVYSPVGYTAWPGECDTVPKNVTIDLEFAGAAESETVTIKVPLSAYVRRDDGSDPGYCILNVDNSGCLFGAPFATSAFFAADDERGEAALAQGGVSAPGSGPDYAKVVGRIP